jgi:hypothetical protein
VDELVEISKLMLGELNYRFGEGTEAVFRDYIERRMKLPRFANGRSVRNALDRARLRQANRLFAHPERDLSRDDLVRIEKEDLLASRVFRDGELDTD